MSPFMTARSRDDLYAVFQVAVPNCTVVGAPCDPKQPVRRDTCRCSHASLNVKVVTTSVGRQLLAFLEELKVSLDQFLVVRAVSHFQGANQIAM